MDITSFIQLCLIVLILATIAAIAHVSIRIANPKNWR